MSRDIQLDVIGPSGPIFSEPIQFLSIMGPEGNLGILPGHLPVFMTIEVGFVEYEKNGNRDFITTMGGILEFHHNHATVLTEGAEHAGDIDELRAQEAHKRAQSRLSEKAGQDALDTARLYSSMERAATRLKVLELLKNRRARKRV